MSNEYYNCLNIDSVNGMLKVVGEGKGIVVALDSIKMATLYNYDVPNREKIKLTVTSGQYGSVWITDESTIYRAVIPRRKRKWVWQRLSYDYLREELYLKEVI